MIKMYAAFALIYITLYFFGRPLRVLLMDGPLRKFDLYIAPWLGIGVIIAVLYPLSWLGYSVESVLYYVVAAA